MGAGTGGGRGEPGERAEVRGMLECGGGGGKGMAQGVVKLTSAKTGGGQSMAVKVADGGVMVDNVHVTKTDIVASNGVIHVVDPVLLPK